MLIKFKDIPVGDVFVFQYELEWKKYLNNRQWKPDVKKFPFIGLFFKVSENEYSLRSILIDHRKKGSFPKIKGYTHKDTYVWVADENQNIRQILESEICE